MTGRFSGKVALVTGGTSGIGAEVARQLAAEGAAVAVVGRDTRRADEVARQIEAAGGVARAFLCDVTDTRSVDEVVAAAEVALGPIDVLVCAAGVVADGEGLTETSDATWSRVIETNLSGTFRVSRAVVKRMAPRGRGAVVIVGSIGSLEALPRTAAYLASKAGLVGLTRSIAYDYAPYGIRAVCVCPAFVQTPLLDGALERFEDPQRARYRMRALHPLGRLGEPDDVARAILFLASDEASWVTGVVLPLDGGLLLGHVKAPPPAL